MEFVGYISSENIQIEDKNKQRRNNDVKANLSNYYTQDVGGSYHHTVIISPNTSLIKSNVNDVLNPIELYRLDLNKLIGLKEAVNAQSDVIVYLFSFVVIFMILTGTLIYRITKSKNCDHNHNH